MSNGKYWRDGGKVRKDSGDKSKFHGVRKDDFLTRYRVYISKGHEAAVALLNESLPSHIGGKVNVVAAINYLFEKNTRRPVVTLNVRGYDGNAGEFAVSLLSARGYGSVGVEQVL